MILHTMLPPLLLCTLVLYMKLSIVAPQTPNENPIAGPAPLVPDAPPPVTAEVPERDPAILQPQPQVTNLLDALRDAGQFGAIAGLLDGLQMKSITPMTTWLVPDDDAFSGSNYPKNVTKFLDYHVIRELLPFSRLMTLDKGTRIPTFLGSETAVVTNNERFNYSINNAMIVVPDLFSDSTIAVHGINAVLDDASYNGIKLPPTPVPSPKQSQAPAPLNPGQPANMTIDLDDADKLTVKSSICVALASASILVAVL